MRSTFIIFFILFNTLVSGSDIKNLKTELSQASGEMKLKLLDEIFIEYINICPDSALKFCLTNYEIAKKQNDPSAIANSLCNLSIAMSFKGNKQKAIDYINQAITIYQTLNDTLRMGHCFHLLSTYFYNFSQFKKANDMMLKCLKIFQKYNVKKGLVDIYYSLSVLHFTLANYNKALEYCLTALTLCSEVDDIRLLAKCHLQISDIYIALNNYSKAVENHSQAINVFKELSDNLLIAISSNVISKLFFKTSQYDSALVYATKALDIYEKMNYKIGISLTLSNLGYIYNSIGNNKLAIDVYGKAMIIAENLNHLWLQSEISSKVGDFYLKEGKLEEAFPHFQKSVKLAQVIDSRDLIKNNYKSLSKYYEELGDYKSSLIYHKKYSALKDSLFLNIQNDITDLQVIFHTEKEHREKQLLQKDNEIYKLEIEKQKFQKSSILLGLIVLTIISVFVFYLYRHKQRMNKILEDKINKAIAKQQEQQQIILHQAGLTSLGELAAGIAHEINQPLQNISFCAEIIRHENIESKDKNKGIEKNVKEIHRHIDWMRNIIEHVRLFSSRQQEEFSQKFTINQSIINAYRMVEKQYTKQGIEIKLDLQADLPQISGNPYKYEQVVLNLLSNAKDAVIEKEKEFGNEYKKEIILRSYGRNGNVFMEMEDNGVGIPNDVRSKIFMPFYTTKKFGEGQGLGLSIALSIIKEMRGRIYLNSKIIGRTIMCIKIPVCKKIGILDAS